MRKTFLARRNALLSERSFSWGAGVLALVIFLFLIRLVAPNIFLFAFAPFFRTADAFATESHAFFGHFSDAAALALANEKITSDNRALASENQALTLKVADLEALLGASGAQKEIPGVLAGVVARPPVSPYDTLVLASGSMSGINLGMEAFGEGGVPVGVVESVTDDFSRVTLFSSPGMATSAWVGRGSVPLTLTGAGGGVLEATVARAANIAVGDVVAVPGPGMLPIGTVVRIDSDPLSPSVTLRIRPAVNPFSISWVIVRATGVNPSTISTSTPL